MEKIAATHGLESPNRPGAKKDDVTTVLPNKLAKSVVYHNYIVIFDSFLVPALEFIRSVTPSAPHTFFALTAH